MSSFVNPQAVSVFVVYQDKYLLIRRCDNYLNGTWQMVTGKIESGEKAWEAALREVAEETGLVVRELYSADAVETFYLKTEDVIAFVPVFVVFVDSPGQVVLSPTEHDAYEWLEVDQARERLVWSEQRRIITHVHENFVLKKPLPLWLIKTQLAP